MITHIYDLTTSPQSLMDQLNLKYQLSQQILGHGSYGVVMQAFTQDTNESVAVKIVPKEKVKIQQLQQEINIQQQLKHVNIIQFREYFADVENYYIVTELATGGELFDLLQKYQRFSEQNTKIIIRQILSFLICLHENNVAHLDLKPENIILSNCFKQQHTANQPNKKQKSKFSPVLKLIDFGSALPFQVCQQINKQILCGTPGYVAPEVLCNKQFTYQPDIYALGVICYILLSGSSPFNTNDLQQLISKQLSNDWNFNHYFDNISHQCKDFISQCLEYNFELRPAAIQLIKHPWLDIVPMCNIFEKQKDINVFLVSSQLKACFYNYQFLNRIQQNGRTEGEQMEQQKQ